MSWLDALEFAADALAGRPHWRSDRGTRRLSGESQDSYTVRVGIIPVLMFPVFAWFAVRSAMYFKGWIAWTLAVLAIAVLLYGLGRYLQVLCRVLRGRAMPRV